jgi:hypothetical protein
MKNNRLALHSMIFAMGLLFSPFALAQQFCDTEIEPIDFVEVGESLDATVRVWNDDCGANPPASWGSTYVEWRLVSDDFNYPYNACFNHEPDHQGFYDTTETYNFTSGLDQMGVYQVRARPYSGDNCTGSRGPRDTETFNVTNPEDSRATFLITKFFTDQNPASVEVTISCDTGIPLTQTASISQWDSVEFVVNDFDSGELDCSITEDVPPGYAANHVDSLSSDPSQCLYENVDQGDPFWWVIFNTLQPVRVDVRKVWFDDHPEFSNPMFARARWNCSNASTGDGADDAQFFGCDGDTCGSLHFYGVDSTDSFYVYPDWDGTTYCWVEERVFESGVESDSRSCSHLSVAPGHGNACTITNTRFYEGIPTLSQYGLAILALLMLGVGLIGFRRFV